MNRSRLNKACLAFSVLAQAGTITFEEFDFFDSATPRTLELRVPRQNVLGILQAITAIRPITLSAQAPVRGF